MRYTPLLRQLTWSALRHPRLLPPLLGAAWRFRARDWYRRPPFLPLPPAEYVEWRLHTAFGDDGALPTAQDLERYLAWSAGQRKRAPQHLRR